MPKKKFCPLIKNMLSDEHKANEEYEALIRSTDDQKMRKVISKIQKDEQKHFKMLKKILDKKCG